MALADARLVIVPAKVVATQAITVQDAVGVFLCTQTMVHLCVLAIAPKELIKFKANAYPAQISALNVFLQRYVFLAKNLTTFLTGIAFLVARLATFPQHRHATVVYFLVDHAQIHQLIALAALLGIISPQVIALKHALTSPSLTLYLSVVCLVLHLV